jgi:protein-tyrosine phosphatase
MKKSVLFVCLGNICRSPAAEGVMLYQLKQEGLHSNVDVDSAGTSAYHTGSPADRRMRETASGRGYDLQSLARQFDPATDFERFDYIVTMDNSNFEDIRSLDPEDRFNNKVVTMASFCQVHDVVQVPDPYYGGADGFELVLDIVEDGCRGLIEQLRKEL